MKPVTAQDWIEVAVRCQRKADDAALLGMDPKLVISYCRRRNVAAARAQALGGDPWDAIAAESMRAINRANVGAAQWFAGRAVA